MRSIFSAILTILYIGYGITAFVFAWDAVSYFSGVHSFFGADAYLVPDHSGAADDPICSCRDDLCPDLLSRRHSGWGYLLAIIYCFPSIGLVILSMISGGVGAISGWLSEKFHRF